MKLAILGGRVLDPANQVDEVANIYIADGIIIASTKSKLLDFSPDLTINADDYIVSPGLVDVSANILPGLVSDELFADALKNAVRAGITHLATPAFTDKRCLSALEINYLGQFVPKQARAYFIGALTQNLQGDRLNELRSLQQAGCIGYSNGYHPIINTLVKKNCYDYAAMLGLKIYLVLNDSYLSDKGCMHQGDTSAHLGLPGIPVISETIALAKELLLVEETGVKAHIYRLSSQRAVSMLEQVKNDMPVTSDIAIHQLFLTDKDVQLSDGYCHVAPPFRTEIDKMSLRAAIKSNRITAISSDHIALSRGNKEVPFQDSAPGIASMPLLLPLTLKFAEEEAIPLLQALSYITSKPASLLGIRAGTLTQGELANVLVFDPNESWSLSEKDLAQFGYNNPFRNWSLKGRVKYTLVDGQVAYKANG